MIEGRTVAALVYRRGQHDINLFVWPATQAASPELRSLRGFNLVAWAADGMALRAVSDLSAADLLAFAGLWAQTPDDGAPAR